MEQISSEGTPMISVYDEHGNFISVAGDAAEAERMLRSTNFCPLCRPERAGGRSLCAGHARMLAGMSFTPAEIGAAAEG